MKLIVLTALVAVCGAAKLDRSYLPPASAQTAGGSDGDLTAPAFRSSQNNPGLSLPKGGYANDHQGIIVDAAAAGTRAAGPVETGLGAPRPSYGSEASKVGDAAFREAAGHRQQNPQNLEQSQSQNGLAQGPQNSQFGPNPSAQNQGSAPQSYEPEAPSNARPQAAQDRQANIVRYDSEVGAESFNYAFETENGIVAEENGVATNGVQAQGGFSYTSDDGQTYSVSYVADENGYQPKGAHLPTPPPIPEEILKSLEKNAQEAANGITDDGSYDAKKYNGGDYAENANDRYSNEQPNKGSRNGLDVSASGSFVNQNIQQSDLNHYLPSNQPQAQQSQPQRSRPDNQQQKVRPQSYQNQASQRQPIQFQHQHNNQQQGAQPEPAQPQWSQPNNQAQNVRPQSYQQQPQIPQQQATRQPWSQQKYNQAQPSQPQWSQSANQAQNARPQYEQQPQTTQQQPTQQPWSQQSNNKALSAQPELDKPQWSQPNNQPQNDKQQYRPQTQGPQPQRTQQPWTQQQNSYQAQPEQPQWSQSNDQPQNERSQSHQQQPQISEQQATPQPWWQQNKNQPQSSQPQWSQANNQQQNARLQSNQQTQIPQHQQFRPQWSQPQIVAKQQPSQPWSQTNNNQPQLSKTAYQQQSLNQPKQPQEQGNPQSASASASFKGGSNAFQASYLPPRSNPQNIALGNPASRPTSQPTQPLSIQDEPAEIPAQIQQLPLTDNEHLNDIVADGQENNIISPRYQQQQPAEASSHVKVPPPTLPPNLSASAQTSVTIGGQQSQYQGKPSYSQPTFLFGSTQQPSYENPEAQQEEDEIIDVSKQDGPTAAVPDFIKYGSQSSFEYSSHSSAPEPTQNYQSDSYGSAEKQNQPQSQSNQPENSQGLYDYQRPQSSEPSSTSNEPSPSTRYPQPPTLAPPTASAIPEADSTITAEASVENSAPATLSAPTNKYLQPSGSSHPQQTDAIAKPFRQPQPFGQRPNFPQQPQQSQFGQKLRPLPQPYNQQPQQPSPQFSQPQQQSNYYQQSPQSSYIPPQSNRRPQPIPQQTLSQQSPSQPPQLHASQTSSTQNVQQPQHSQPQQYNSYQQPISQQPKYQNVQQPTHSIKQDQPNSYQYNQPQEQLVEVPQGLHSYEDQQPLNSYQQPLNYQPDKPSPNQSEDSNNPSSPNAPAQQNYQELNQYGEPEDQPSTNDNNAEDSAPEVIATGQPNEQNYQPDLQTSDNSEQSSPDVQAPEQNQFAAAAASGAPDQGYRSPVAGAGEVFDSQRQKPSNSYDDETGYHY